VKIIADENVYDPMVDFLIRKGHDVLNTRRTALAGASDEEVFQRAVRDQRVIVVKLYRLKADDATALFALRFSALDERTIHGRLIIMTRDTVRVRTPRHA